jgi:hypothetical protein
VLATSRLVRGDDKTRFDELSGQYEARKTERSDILAWEDEIIRAVQSGSGDVIIDGGMPGRGAPTVKKSAGDPFRNRVTPRFDGKSGSVADQYGGHARTIIEHVAANHETVTDAAAETLTRMVDNMWDMESALTGSSSRRRDRGVIGAVEVAP